MNKFLFLLKLEFQGLFFSSKRKNKYGFHVIALLLSALALLISTIYSYGIYASIFEVQKATQIECMYIGLALMFVVSSIITLFTTIMKINGTLFNFKEYDILMSLPIKPKYIILSKLTSLFLLNLLFTFLILAPNIIIYGIYVNPSILFYVIAFASIPFIPVIPTIIAAFIGFLISYISSRMRNPKIFTSLITIIFMLGITLFFILLPSLSKEEVAEIHQMIDGIYNQINVIYPLTKIYIKTVVSFDALNIIVFVMINILTAFIFSTIMQYRYNSINSMLKTTRQKGNLREVKISTQSKFKAIFMKDLKKFLHTPIYFLNTSMGAIMAIIIALILAFTGTMTFGMPVEISGMELSFFAMNCVCLAMTATTSVSTSIEGNNFWIIKSVPIDEKSYFNAKAALNLILLIPTSLIIAIIYILSNQLFDALTIVILFLYPISISFFVTFLGLCFNIWFPRFDFRSETQLVKQSIPSMLGIFIPMLIIGFFGTLSFQYNSILYLFVVTIIMIILGFTCYTISKKTRHTLLVSSD